MCPHCGRDAPIVYRGALAYCTACGGLRAPLSSPSVNLTGKPARVGGTMASVLGALVLLVGLSVAAGLGFLLYAIASAAVALAVTTPIALIVLATGVALLTGGRSLRRSGTDAARATRDQALFELAAHRSAITASDAARALGVTVPEADEMLTSLAKRDPERIAIDVDERGTVWYRAASPREEAFDARLRVAERARVDEQAAGAIDETEEADEEASLRR